MASAYDLPGQSQGPPAYCGRLCNALTAAVDVEIRGAPSFACCGTLERGGTAPIIEVPEIGRLDGRSPVTREQATSLQRVCQQAPFGRGEETVVDTHVRVTLQLDPAKFRIVNEADWNNRLSHVLTDVCARLAVPQPAADVSAQLHKLLLYKPGSFFKRHTDSEKAPGMFGTLVVYLPAAYSGGQLLVYHRGDSQRFGSGELPPDVVSYAAFYADCEHEVKRVTSGYRLCLTYNLCYSQARGSVTHSVRAGDSTAVARAAEAMSNWQADDNGPTMLCYVLDHLYTSRSRAALSVGALKGADATRAQVAITAAAQAGVEIALVRLRRREDGEGEESEPTYGYTSYSEDESDSEGDSSDGGMDKCGKDGRRVSSGSDHGMMDIYQIDDLASEWVTVTGVQLGFKEIALNNGCMLQDWHFWRHIQPSSRVGEGYTGNEGSPLSLWYTQTALVMWRKKDNIVMQLQGTGFTPLITYLTQLVGRMQHLQQQQQQQQAMMGQIAEAQAAGSASPTQNESPQAAAAAAAAGTSTLAAAAAAGPPAYDGERQLLLPDINVYGTGEVCWVAAQEVAGRLMMHHGQGGIMSSTDLAQLLCVLAQVNNPYLLETYFSGPFKAATAYATSCMKSKSAANGHSVFYVITASGRSFSWADLGQALIQCCSVMPWEQVKVWWMQLLKEYLVTVRDMRLTSADDDLNHFWSRDNSHNNPLAFQAAYSQVVALVLQPMGQHIRGGTAAVLEQQCTYIPELPKIPGTKYHSNDDLYTSGDSSDEESPDNDSHAKYKFQMAIESAVKKAATAAEAAVAAGTVLPSAGALADFHDLVSCDPGPDQITSVLSGLPSWQVQACKDMLGMLLEVMAGEDGNAWPVDVRSTDYRDCEMPIVLMPRDAGLLLSLLQAVYVLGSEQQLHQLVQHITRQPRLYAPTATLAPAALEFCHWLGDSRLAESAGAVQLLKDCLARLQQLTTGGSPDEARDKWKITSTHHLRLCSPQPGSPKCKSCEDLKEFLLSGDQQRWRFRATRKDRDHLRGVVPPYITWSQQQLQKHTYSEYQATGPQPESSSAAQATAKCPIEIISDTDDPRSRQPETVRRAEQAAVAAVRSSQQRGSRFRYSDRGADIKPPEYVPGRRAPGMSAAKEAAMARTGELIMQKKNQPLEKLLQQYRDTVNLLRSLQAIANRLGWATPLSAGAGTSADAAEAVGAVKQEGDTTDVKMEQAAATAASGQERSSPSQDVKQEQLFSTYQSEDTAAAASAKGGATAVKTKQQSMPTATRRRGTSFCSSRKHERHPAGIPAADAPVTRSRANAAACAAGPTSKRAKKGRK